jgi:hypothetical protein
VKDAVIVTTAPATLQLPAARVAAAAAAEKEVSAVVGSESLPVLERLAVDVPMTRACVHVA